MDFATWTRIPGPKRAPVTVSTPTPLPNTEGTNYCGSASDFEKVSVPVPDPDKIKHSFSTANNVYKILPLNVRSSIVSQKVGLFLIYFTFVVHFKCSTTGKPTHLFRTKCVSLDSV